MTSVATLLQQLPRTRHPRPVQPEIKSRARSRALAAIPVAGILVMQAALSIRLLHASTASGDEAIYIYSGHQLIHELWHGGGSPYFETWLSGAPIIYPVLAAMVDHLGGLVLVRLMSAAFMLAATGLLYATARRLFGYWPAIAAAGLFASLGITQSLGAYATFDAMSLMLTAFAAYCAVRAASSTKWLLAIPVVLLLANATKYASALFDPVVIGLAALMLRTEGWRRVGQRAASLTLVTAALMAISVALAGTAYLRGILYTTIARQAGTGMLNLNPAASHVVIAYSWRLIGLVVCLGALAVVAAAVITGERSSACLLGVLAAGGMLVTLEALHIHDTTSVNKHDDFGVWFSCIPAGYAFARGAELARAWYKRGGFIVAALASVAITLYAYGAPAPAGSDYGTAGVLGPVVPYLKADSAARYLLGGRNSRVILYDYHLAIPWQREFDDDYVKYPLPGHPGTFLTGSVAARAAIRAHWFAVVSFVGQNDMPIDVTELNTVRTTPGYKLVSTAGGPTYVYAPDYPWLLPKVHHVKHNHRHRHRRSR